eukprot:XP_001703740.1 predicted protein [Chlamydomonas reinhardtii]
MVWGSCGIWPVCHASPLPGSSDFMTAEWLLRRKGRVLDCLRISSEWRGPTIKCESTDPSLQLSVLTAPLVQGNVQGCAPHSWCALANLSYFVTQSTSTRATAPRELRCGSGSAAQP